MTAGKWVCRVFAAILPWPARAERRARVAAARNEAARSQRRAGEAKELERDIYAAVRKNHWVQIITDGLIEARHYQKPGDHET